MPKNSVLRCKIQAHISKIQNDSWKYLTPELHSGIHLYFAFSVETIDFHAVQCSILITVPWSKIKLWTASLAEVCYQIPEIKTRRNCNEYGRQLFFLLLNCNAVIVQLLHVRKVKENFHCCRYFSIILNSNNFITIQDM